MKQSIKIEGNRPHFWQWDLNQRLILEGFPAGVEVHFAHQCDLDPTAPVVESYEEGGTLYADVPNILLQHGGTLTVYIYRTVDPRREETIFREAFIIRAREKPGDYVYTATEVKSWEALDARIRELEENGVSDEQIEEAVSNYLAEHPVDSGLPEITEADNGKVLTAENGQWVAKQLPKYGGDYEVTPGVDGQTLPTAQKFMENDVNIKAIPYYETSNAAGGSTVYIADEVEIY